MEPFLAAYSILGFAVVMYVARLGLQQHRLRRQLEAMEERSRQTVGESGPRARAA